MYWVKLCVTADITPPVGNSQEAGLRAERTWEQDRERQKKNGWELVGKKCLRNSLKKSQSQTYHTM